MGFDPDCFQPAAVDKIVGCVRSHAVVIPWNGTADVDSVGFLGSTFVSGSEADFYQNSRFLSAEARSE